MKNINNINFSEVAITSSFKLHEINNNTDGFSLDEIPNVIVKAIKVKGQKCQRCWKYEDTLIKNEICDRCNNAIN